MRQGAADPVIRNRIELKHAAGVVQESVPSDHLERLERCASGR